MDLKRYKEKIKNQLLNGVEAQARKEKAISEGDYVAQGGAVHVPHYKIPKGDYDELIRRMNDFKGLKISMPSHITTGHECGGDMYDSDDSNDVGGSFVGKNVKASVMRKCGTVHSKAPMRQQQQEETVEGGKFHFVKSMKHLGHSVQQTGEQFGTALKKAGINEATKAIAQEGVKYAKNSIGQLMTGEALPVAEEAAPMMLMAAGMKKPKRTRRVSQKEANRHALIRKLMQQHGCSLAEASRHIKEENLDY